MFWGHHGLLLSGRPVFVSMQTNWNESIERLYNNFRDYSTSILLNCNEFKKLASETASDKECKLIPTGEKTALLHSQIRRRWSSPDSLNNACVCRASFIETSFEIIRDTFRACIPDCREIVFVFLYCSKEEVLVPIFKPILQIFKE